ncbi:hypothetical protein L2449_28880 [Mesorhizobium muleiense]|uniref:hypothetical protein n=1 Tax=Mesorhizobium muleiense TaxID=1004279 RepID=UPI001F2404A6|nr:hypothetical protein [Mesorhizobium muleiense]MCF6120843.1 hypothetical protein [Mesorhizobium muleiense]
MATTRQVTRKCGDAYMLMKYTNDAGEVEWIWNSRDGVSPFGVQSRHGKGHLTHADWHEDAFVPNFVPPVGMRIFVDLTMERALVSARRQVTESWDRGNCQMKDHPHLGPMGQEGAAAALAKEYVGNGYQPTVEVVTEEIRAAFAKLAFEQPFHPGKRA